MTKMKQTIVAGMSAVALAAGMAAVPTAASARGFGFGWGHHHHWYPSYGYGLYGVGYASDCYIVRRAVTDGFGNVFIRRVRVCG